MPAHRTTLALVVALAAAPAVVQAQEPTARAIDQTGTGGGPASTMTAPNTNSLGVTKPPGGSGVSTAGPSAERISERDRREKAKNDRIANSICRGC